MNSSEQIGVFFDLDGTLLAPPSLEWRFIGFLLARDEIGGLNLARWLGHCAKTILRDPRVPFEGNKRYLTGLRESLAADWSVSQAARELPFFAEGVARMAWHHAQQHRIFLLSGTLAPLARAIAPQLPCPVEICATELEVLGRHWTGFLAGSNLSGGGKARTIRAITARRNLALAHSFAYGNQMADLPMLSAVGHPVAVNPSARLVHRARKRGWTICRWNQPQAAVHFERRNLLAPEELQ
jgi:HAD superfamily phosphoserine phosphatase-like hydrolase